MGLCELVDAKRLVGKESSQYNLPQTILSMATSETKTQIAAWLEKPEHGARLQIRNDIEIPVPGNGELLVKLDYTGFCHSDVHSIYGETPMETDIAGHEGLDM